MQHFNDTHGHTKNKKPTRTYYAWMSMRQRCENPTKQSYPRYGERVNPIRIDRCPKCAAVLRERTVEQNAKLHAVLHDISTQKRWAGRWLDIEAWKRLMVSAWERANGRGAEFYPALDGAGFDVVYRRTSRMSQQEMRELIDFAESWALENGVELKDLHETTA